MPSFDIVSEIDKHELKNAVDNAQRELSTRFDFRGVDAEIKAQESDIVLSAEADFQVNQLRDIVINQLVKRGIEAASMDSSDIQHSGKSFKQTLKFEEGIATDKAKKIVKLVKDAKIKVQVAIQGDQLRVTGKKRDDLQSVIALLKNAELELALQYKNFRD